MLDLRNSKYVVRSAELSQNAYLYTRSSSGGRQVAGERGRTRDISQLVRELRDVRVPLGLCAPASAVAHGADRGC